MNESIQNNLWDSLLESLRRIKIYTVFTNHKIYTYGKMYILNKKTGQLISIYFGKDNSFTIYKFYHGHEIKHLTVESGTKLKNCLGLISEYFNENNQILGSNVYNLRYNKIIKYCNVVQPKKIVYVDLDGVLVDIAKEFNKYKIENPNSKKDLIAYIDTTEDGFLNAEPMEGGIEAVERLEKKYDVFILSTAPWKNLNSWVQKRQWVEKYLPSMRKKLILANNKDLLNGDFLIDDRLRNGAGEFNGEHIHIFSNKFPDWDIVLKKLNV